MKRPKRERYYASTANGAVWGIGSTPESARRDGRKIVGAPKRLVVREITEEQALRIARHHMQVSMEAMGVR